jgi:hypothetical protein
MHRVITNEIIKITSTFSVLYCLHYRIHKRNLIKMYWINEHLGKYEPYFKFMRSKETKNVNLILVPRNYSTYEICKHQPYCCACLLILQSQILLISFSCDFCSSCFSLTFNNGNIRKTSSKSFQNFSVRFPRWTSYHCVNTQVL